MVNDKCTKSGGQNEADYNMRSHGVRARSSAAAPIELQPS
jgi:hypothetical protein